VIAWLRPDDGACEFEEVALAHLGALYQTALRLTRNRAEAEDLVQETYLRAFRAFHRFDPGTNCRAWLFTILRNAFLNRVRHSGRELLEADTAGWEARQERAGSTLAGETPEERFFRTVVHGDVERALQTVPYVFREAVILADFEGLSYREIAEVVGCPIGTVMSRLSRGRQALRRELARLGREHGYVRESE
jgi:RNA polymerase sigma-70 factor (ECF subfamily)